MNKLPKIRTTSIGMVHLYQQMLQRCKCEEISSILHLNGPTNVMKSYVQMISGKSSIPYHYIEMDPFQSDALTGNKMISNGIVHLQQQMHRRCKCEKLINSPRCHPRGKCSGGIVIVRKDETIHSGRGNVPQLRKRSIWAGRMNHNSGKRSTPYHNIGEWVHFIRKRKASCEISISSEIDNFQQQMHRWRKCEISIPNEIVHFQQQMHQRCKCKIPISNENYHFQQQMHQRSKCGISI